ncbi:hypothetical protein ASPBRDRAFT_677751 [Aspergillus brasiliensis CBS 101740]|uniref:Secreted protein n=1 Tax=Aspergillus brasiliensis (strain CBS 101740 / IMI 381727 / IBT 21946) TaxID=767769 RepID=A0A1L9UG75_ASPBC|nr:hypothetical protein ASPBRDRAFT_677751 [Aspergillus brasiliensis CBS 101740]
MPNEPSLLGLACLFLTLAPARLPASFRGCRGKSPARDSMDSGLPPPFPSFSLPPPPSSSLTQPKLLVRLGGIGATVCYRLHRQTQEREFRLSDLPLMIMMMLVHAKHLRSRSSSHSVVASLLVWGDTTAATTVSKRLTLQLTI